MGNPYTIGDTLFLQQRVSIEDEPLTYKARVADLSEQYISIEMPLGEKTGKIGFFPEGCEIEVWFYTQDGSKYFFPSSVLGRRKERIPLTLLTHPIKEDINRTQRREFLRVPCYEEVAIHPLRAGNFAPFLAKAIDLSGGGLAFVLPKLPGFPEGSEVRWWLSLPLKSGSILHPSGVGKIVRIIEPAEKGLPYRFPLEFSDILETDRQKIIKYCFERQLEIKKKGIDF
jgi:c-di-GMP-binding flagellar brake protein YcgR